MNSINRRQFLSTIIRTTPALALCSGAILFPDEALAVDNSDFWRRDRLIDIQRTDTGETGRWRSFGREWIRKEKGDSLDISWLKDESLDGGDELSEPEELARGAIGELEAAIKEIGQILDDITQST